MFRHSPCIRTLFSICLLYLNWFGTFLIVSLSLPLFLFTLVVSMAPKRKSTPSWNPLRFGALSSSDPTPSYIQFHDEDARKDFLENFSRWGVHSECWVILADFADIDLPTLWRPSHLSIFADPGVLLQHAWIQFSSTSLFYLRLRYTHCSHTTACCRCASCFEGKASWLPRLWVTEDCVQRRDDFRLLWACRRLGWLSIYTM